MIIVGVIITLVIGLVIGLFVALAIVRSRSWAKKQAREMIEGGDRNRDFDGVCKILSAIPNDPEAQELWKKLQELRGVENT